MPILTKINGRINSKRDAVIESLEIERMRKEVVYEVLTELAEEIRKAYDVDLVSARERVSLLFIQLAEEVKKI